MVYLRIVLPTKNEEKYLPKLLASIKKQKFSNFEIIVADADSTDNTRKIALSYSCKVVKGGYLDIGRNNGAKGCKTPIICFIDSDIILPDSNFISKALKEFKERKLDVAGTLQKPILTHKKLNDFFYKAFYEFANFSMKLSQNSKKPFMQTLIFMKTSVHKKLKGFLPYEFGEDSAFAKNAVAHGYKFGILEKPGKAWISPRRFEKNSFFLMLIKYIYFNGMRMLGHEFIRGKTSSKYW